MKGFEPPTSTYNGQIVVIERRSSRYRRPGTRPVSGLGMIFEMHWFVFRKGYSNNPIIETLYLIAAKAQTSH